MQKRWLAGRASCLPAIVQTRHRLSECGEKLTRAWFASGPYGHSVREIRSSIMNFTIVDLVHESRASNGDVHMLTKSSIYESLGRQFWFLTLHSMEYAPMLIQLINRGHLFVSKKLLEEKNSFLSFNYHIRLVLITPTLKPSKVGFMQS